MNDPAGLPWQHAVRGRRPLRPVVTGYGHTAPAADADARTKASQADAREVLGERGEVKASAELGGFEIPPELWEACQRVDDEGRVIKVTLGGWSFHRVEIATESIPGTPVPAQDAFARFCGTYGVSETMLLDAGWHVEDGVWIAPPNLIEQSLKEVYEEPLPAPLMGLPVVPWNDAPSLEGVTFGKPLL